MADPTGEEVPDLELDEDMSIGDMDISLDNYLVNEQGENIADIFTGISKHLELQNKILLKMYSVLSKKA